MIYRWRVIPDFGQWGPGSPYAGIPPSGPFRLPPLQIQTPGLTPLLKCNYSVLSGYSQRIIAGFTRFRSSAVSRKTPRKKRRNSPVDEPENRVIGAHIRPGLPSPPKKGGRAPLAKKCELMGRSPTEGGPWDVVPPDSPRLGQRCPKRRASRPGAASRQLVFQRAGHRAPGSTPRSSTV